MMNLELLPNEILLDLFGYFYGTDLLRAFYGLNSRFNVLLYKQFRSYYFQFNCVSKRNFDLICQKHLPFNADRVITLRLSDYRNTPEQINLFFFYIPQFRQFTHLRSLTVSILRSYEILIKLLDECQHFNHFTCLTFYFCSFSDTSADFQLVINKIWSLPKLTNCHFGVEIKGQQTFCLPTIISSSLKRLYISRSKLRWNQIDRLFDYTPRLKDLSIVIESSGHDNDQLSSLPTLIKLNLSCHNESATSKINVVLQSMTNLCHLDIDISRHLIDGYKWEQIIRNHLPKLKTFRLKMKKRVWSNENIQEQANELINSFRTSFWIDERQWFVRCFISHRSVHLYTLSNAFNYYGCTLPDSWQSTSPYDNQQEFYNEITDISDETIFNQPLSSNICLPNINCLYMKLPINNQFWSIVPNLDKLNSLRVSSHTDTFQSQLQTLLDRAPYLHTLRISQDSSLSLQISLFQYTNASVRTLDLYDYNHCFNEEECLLLSRSPLSIQCQVLSIQVQNREGIIHLVRNMLNLRSLRVYWDDEQDLECLERANTTVQCYNEITQTVDQPVQWLKDHLPSTCSVVYNLHYGRDILIWI